MKEKEELSFLESILESYGDEIEGRDLAGEFISTGCLSLDMSIGTGGIPIGRFTEIYGSEGSAKTTIALTVSRNAIKMGKKVLYVEPENLLDYNLVNGVIGEVLSKEMFILLQPNTAEDTLEIMERGIASGEFGLIVLDSLGALAPEVEQKSEITDMQMGTTPKLLAKFFRRNSYTLRTLNKTAVLLLNQVRDNIGSYSKGFSVPGGHALKHFCSLIIALSKGQEIKQDNQPIGITTTFVIKKNKLSSPFRGYTIPIMFGRGVDFYKDFVSFTEDMGIITKSGPFYKFGDEILGKGVLNTIEYLKNSKETLDRITERCYNCIVNKEVEELILTEKEEPNDTESTND